MVSAWVYLYTIVLLSVCCGNSSDAFVTPGTFTRSDNNRLMPKLKMRDDGTEDQAMEALQSLGDFHQGSWSGKAISFTVSEDTAAGILQKKTSDEYKLDVKLAYERGDLAISETFSWKDEENKATKSSRNLSLSSSNVDIDAVDASYSADSSLPNIPSAVTGTEKFIQFAVEQCIAVSDDERVRLFALYQDKLVRVVVCEEKRMPEKTALAASNLEQQSSVTDKLSTSDLIELQQDVDRLVDRIAGQVQGNTLNPKSNASIGSSSSPQQRIDRLQEVFVGSASNNRENNKKSKEGPRLFRHTMSLLDLTSGVWLGDSIIRDFPTIPSANSSEKASGKGFGSSAPSLSGSQKTTNKAADFASWEVGVQKIARQWLWDFGDEIRQVNEAGKALGTEMEPVLGKSLSGAVCGKESFSRRIPKEDRMVYVDWNDGNGGDHVGFLLGSISIQVRRERLLL